MERQPSGLRPCLGSCFRLPGEEEITGCTQQRGGRGDVGPAIGVPTKVDRSDAKGASR